MKLNKTLLVQFLWGEPLDGELELLDQFL